MKRSEAAKLWTMIATVYAEGLRWLDGEQDRDGKTQLARTSEIYETFLLDLDYAAANAALTRLIATWRPTSANRCPSIADLRAAVTAQTAGPVLAGGEAWGAVQRLIGRWGSYREPGQDFTVEDPIAARCIDALGWRELCQSENPTADRARFIELYDRLAAEVRADVVVGALAPPPPRALGAARLQPALPAPGRGRGAS